MRHISRLLLLCAGGSLLLLTGCQTGQLAGGPYHVTAYRPNNPSAVRVLVSLSKQNIYVMEGDRCLMAVACSVGTSAKPTPKGNFKIYSKQEHKRSGSYGFSVQGDRIIPSTGGGGGRYVGYPMGYWCEFAPAYGFHQGFVHPKSAHTRLYPAARRSCAEIFRARKNRDSGKHRHYATRGRDSCIESAACG
jgi:hypothetical protein